MIAPIQLEISPRSIVTSAPWRLIRCLFDPSALQRSGFPSGCWKLLDAEPQRVDAEFEKAAKDLKKLQRPRKPKPPKP